MIDDPLSDEFLLDDNVFPQFPNDFELERLSIDSNIHDLQLKVERIKRQKLGFKLKPLKRELSKKR